METELSRKWKPKRKRRSTTKSKETGIKKVVHFSLHIVLKMLIRRMTLKNTKSKNQKKQMTFRIKTKLFCLKTIVNKMM